MKTYQVVILAGGLGTRLFPATKTIPKVLVQVAGRPYIFWQLDLLAANKIDEVILCVGFLGGEVEKTVGNNYRGITIKYSYEQPDKLLATAGAIKNAESFLNSSFGVLYGDSYLEIDYRAVFEAHLVSRFPATMTIWRNEDKYDISNVALTEDKKRVARYEKVKERNVFHYIDYGFSVLNKDIIAYRLGENEVSALSDLQRDLSCENLLGAFEVHKRFYEIWSKTGIAELEKYLTSKRVKKKESFL